MELIKTCILCGSDKFSSLYNKDNWNVLKCDMCSLGFLSPRPDSDELNELYVKEYFKSHYDVEVPFNSPLMNKKIEQKMHNIRFLRKFKKTGAILDIGCGRGYFLLACRKKGYQVTGIDVSQDVAAYVRKELNIPILVGSIEALDIPLKSFDIITMWHSLEHTTNPNLYIETARKWLKDDGLLIIEVPNYKGHDAQMTWENWPGWSLPYHLYHFTRNTLLALLNKHGFQAVREKDYLSEYEKERLDRIHIPSFITRLIARLYSGHSIAILAKKYVK